jgi:Uma2 family endonuclease
MPLYARHGVRYAWIVDPRAHSLEAFELREGNWRLIEAFAEDDKVAVEPFEKLPIDLAEFWI